MSVGAGLRTRWIGFKRVVPPPVKRVGRAGLGALDPLSVRRFRRRTGWTAPVPPRALRSRVGAPVVGAYVTFGRTVADEIEAALQGLGRDLHSFGSVLDFGCGPGRVLQHLVPRLHADADVAGCDVDGPAVQWLDRHAGRGTFVANDFRPPLPFEDGRFELVYSISVLTHVDEEAQDRWLAELRRVLAPAGIGLLSTHGPSAYERFREGDVLGLTAAVHDQVREREPLREEGFVYVPYEPSSRDSHAPPDSEASYGLAFHSEEYVRRTWSRWYEVRDVLPAAVNWGQDLVVVTPR